MAAPPNAYYTIPMTLEYNSVKINSLVAIPDTTKEVLKARFYLDIILVVDRYDANGNKIPGFIGGCLVGSDNYYMHNTARWFKLRGSEYSNYVFFNDAGLNTLGRASSVQAKSRFEVYGLEFQGVYDPAWYVAGSAEVRFREVGNSVYSDWLYVQSVAEKRTTGNLFVADWRFWNIHDIFPTYKVGMQYEVQVRFSNVEGVGGLNTWATSYVTIKPYLTKLRRGASPSAAWNSTALYDVYPDQRLIDIGTVFYQDENMQSVHQGGTYMLPDDGVWYAIDLNGVVTSKGYYNPISDIVYQGGLSRNNTSGGKFGSYTVSMFVRNNGTTATVCDETRIVLGTLKPNETVINTANLQEVFAQHTFAPITIGANSESNRFDYGNIDLDFNYGIWVYITLKNNQQIGADYVI